MKKKNKLKLQSQIISPSTTFDTKNREKMALQQRGPTKKKTKYNVKKIPVYSQSYSFPLVKFPSNRRLIRKTGEAHMVLYVTHMKCYL